MAIYAYKGLEKSGKEVKSTINSESLQQAKSKIRSSGIMLVEIKEQKTKGDQGKGGFNFSFGSGVPIDDLSLMTRQLATLVKANIQIVDALTALQDQTENDKLRVILSEVKGKVNEGISLADAFADYPAVFNNVYVNMVEAGEQSGNLQVVLMKLAEFTEAQQQLKGKVTGALTYPVIMLFIAMIMFGVIFTVVIPKITKIFESMKKEVPLNTQVCIWISHFVQSYWWAILLFQFFAAVTIKWYINTKKGKARFDTLVLKMPIISPIVMMVNVSRFSSTLATLLQSGVPILTALKIVKNIISNVHMQAAVEESRVNVSEGASMVEPLQKSGLYPPMVTHMMKLGEQSGELEEMLRIVAENYEDQVNNKLSGLTSTIEPIMIVGMGISVGFVVFSVIMPMMELNSMGR